MGCTDFPVSGAYHGLKSLAITTKSPSSDQSNYIFIAILRIAKGDDNSNGFISKIVIARCMQRRYDLLKEGRYL